MNDNILRYKKPPCYTCCHRTYDCHTTCLSYKEWEQYHEVYKMQLREKASPGRQYSQYKYKQTSRNMHNSNRSSKR